MLQRRFFIPGQAFRNKRAESSRERTLSLILIDSHGKVRTLGCSIRSILTAATLLVLLTVSLIYFGHSYLSISRELKDLEYVRDVARSQAEEIQKLQQQYDTLAERLRQAELMQSQARETLQKEGLIPQSFASSITVTSRSSSDVTYRDLGSNLGIRDLRRALDKLSADSKQIEDLTARVEKETQDFSHLTAQLVAFERAQPSSWPVQGRITSYFGWRRHPITGARELHSGIDIAADYHTPIRATADGTVIYASYESGYGRMVKISHGYGLETWYAHCASLKVKVGQKVKRGDIIAYVGESGTATGPHLHYEIHKDGVAIDPLSYLQKNNSARE